MQILKISNFQHSNLFFKSKLNPQELDTSETLLNALEIAAASRASEVRDIDKIPHFFNLDLKNFLSEYNITKGLNSGFFDKLSKQRRFKAAIKAIEAGINNEYCEIAKINYVTASSQIPKKVQSNVLKGMYYYRTVQQDTNNPILIHIFSNKEVDKKAYLKTTPDNQIIELITSKITSNSEEKDCLYAFDTSGKLALFEEVQNDNSIRTLVFSENKIIAKEKDSSGKLKSKRKFEYNNGFFKEIN